MRVNMDDYVETMINEFQMKISKSDTALNPDWNKIIEIFNRKIMGKKKLNSSILQYK